MENNEVPNRETGQPKIQGGQPLRYGRHLYFKKYVYIYQVK